MILNIRLSSVCLTLLLVTACAANPDAQTEASTPQNCVREYRTGSNIPVLNCNAPQTDAERQRALDEAKNDIRNIPRLPKKGEGG